MNVEDLPRTVLTCGACLVSGFILAMWCMPLLNSKPRTPMQKSGFSILLPVTQLKSIDRLGNLRGKAVHFLRSPAAGGASCVIDHAPLSFSIQDGFAVFSGSVDLLENFVINVSLSDLRNIDLIDRTAGADRPAIPSCRLHPKISYGE